MNNSVLGVVILYYPDLDLLNTNLASLLNQVDEILIFNNGDYVKFELIENEKISYINNGTNQGISKVLNLALSYADEHKFEYMLIMDQDSILDDLAVHHLLTGFDTEKVAIVSPTIVDAKTNRIDTADSLYKNIKYAITSGSLIKVQYALKINGYDENLFIDYADFDFSIRFINAGYLVRRSQIAKIVHCLGEPQKVRLCGLDFYIINRPPERLFIISKNIIRFAKKFYKTNFFLVVRFITSYLIYMLKIIFFTSNKNKKINKIFSGLKEGFFN